MNICICGASGFIGKNLSLSFKLQGYSVMVITRNDLGLDILQEKLQGQEVLINLAGESIMRRWTARNKKAIYNSRILTTRQLVEGVNNMKIPLRLFINVSAVDIYDKIHEHREDSEHFSDSFLSAVVQDWEAQLDGIDDQVTRVVILRLGVVLNRDGGMLLAVGKPYAFRIGFDFHLKRSFPVIHLKDLIRIFGFIVDHNEICGKVNAVAPFRSDIRGFFQVLNKRLKPLVILPVYKFLVRLLLGESAVMITGGQTVIPSVLIRAGFLFEYDSLERIMNDLDNK
jgi:uncharacterized protein